MEDTFLSDKHRNWRLILDKPATAAHNMAVDEAILLCHAAGKVPPTLRLYQWDPPAISIGFSQNLFKEVDVEGCKQMGLDIVRRPTGGRAVLHDKELTYSVIIHTDYLPGSVLQTYKFLSRGLMEAINLLGLTAEIAAKPVRSSSLGSPACFDSSSWYEIKVKGRKVVGSAQTRRKGALLQHGSILLDLEIHRLQQAMFAPNEKVRQRLGTTLSRKATAINPELLDMGQEPVQADTVQQAVVEGFQRALGITLEPSVLTEQEKAQVEKLVKGKYSNPDWTYLRKECGA